MKIAEKTYAAIDYCLTLDSGEEVDRSQEGQPLSFVTGSGMIIPGLEKELTGMAAGDTAKITIEAEDGYGAVRDDLLQEVPKNQFPADTDIQPGMAFQAQGPQGPFMIVVKSVQDDAVTVDLNHPMAGKRLHFDVKIVEVREATAEELAPPAAGGCGCSGPSEDTAGCGCESDEAPSSGCGSGCACG